ncbi:hypothetical protein D4R75_04775 [bacterium]|nr:MAG: hypothetical protein D4R75_04775 [bacterium]
MTQALAINSSDNIFPGTFSGVVFRSAQATPTLPAAPANVVTSAGNESGFSNEVNARPSSSDLVQIAGGAFQMGNTTGQSNEIPVDSVTLSSFHIDETEITYEKWTDVRIWGLTHGYTDLVAGRNGYTGTTNHPVEE